MHTVEAFTCIDSSTFARCSIAMRAQPKNPRTPSSTSCTMAQNGRGVFMSDTRSFASSRSIFRVWSSSLIWCVYVLYVCSVVARSVFYCCCCCCCRFFLTSFSFGIVQIKSGVSLFVHLLFSMYIGLWFVFSFSNLLWFYAPFIVCGWTECLLLRLQFIHMHWA